MNKFGAIFLGGALTLGSFGAGYLTRAATYEEPKRSSMSWIERQDQLINYSDRLEEVLFASTYSPTEKTELSRKLRSASYRACMTGVVDTPDEGWRSVQENLLVLCGWKDSFDKNDEHNAFKRFDWMQ
jgi:hypothetical protein